MSNTTGDNSSSTAALIKRLHAEVVRLREENKDIKKRLDGLEAASTMMCHSSTPAPDNNNKQIALVREEVALMRADMVKEASKQVTAMVMPKIKQLANVVQYVVGDNETSVHEYRNMVMMSSGRERLQAIEGSEYGAPHDVHTMFGHYENPLPE